MRFSRSGLMNAQVVLMGDRRVGTSSLLRRYNHGFYTDTYKPEKEELVTKTTSVFHPKKGRHVMVEFLDVEGANMTTALNSAHKAHAAAVVYDISNRSSFELAQKYLDGINPLVSALLVGTKLDLKNVRKVSHEEGRLLARIHRVDFIETSAKLNYNVDEAFQILVSRVPDQFLVHGTPRGTRRKLASPETVHVLSSQKSHKHHPNHHPKMDNPSRLSQQLDHLEYEPGRLRASANPRLHKSTENLQPTVQDKIRNSHSFYI